MKVITETDRRTVILEADRDELAQFLGLGWSNDLPRLAPGTRLDLGKPRAYVQALRWDRNEALRVADRFESLAKTIRDWTPDAAILEPPAPEEPKA